jgi:methyl-galactoside transport system permease protein
LNGEIAKIHTQAKETDKKLRAEYASVKKVPMKRADKVTKLDALKSEIYKNSGNADLEILERKNSIKTLKSKHKTTMDKYSNDLHLETDRVATLVKNIRNEEKAKLAPHKEKLDELRKNYKPVAPIYERVGLGVSFWAREWVAKQRKSFSSWRNFSDWFVHNAVYLIILAMVIFTGIKKPSWVSFPSLINILKHTSALLPLALGVAGTIVLTGTDLSLGKIWCFTALLAAVLLAYSGPDGGIIIKWTQNMPWIWIIVVLIVVLVAGGLFGAVNGFFVAQFSIHPFVVTLATQLIINGAILLFADQLKFSVTYSSNLGIANSYNDFVSGGFYIGNTLIEWYNIFAIILIIATWFIWNKTKFGKAMFAVGCNPDAANVSGINVNRTILWTFILAGIMYGFGGFIYNPINGGAQLTTGTGGELDPITAAVIGGVSFTGGIGKVSGVFIGCVLLKVIDSCLTAIGAQPAWVNIAKGAIILFAVALDMKKYIVKK